MRFNKRTWLIAGFLSLPGLALLIWWVSVEITTTAFHGGPLIAPNSTGCQITTTASNQVFQAADGMDILWLTCAQMTQL
jgi:hypothetical protein